MADNEVIYLTRAEIEELSEAIAARVVAEVFRDLGLSAGRNASLEEAKAIRADLQFLRDWRELCEMTRHRGVSAVIGMTVAAFCIVLALGVKAWFSQ